MPDTPERPSNACTTCPPPRQNRNWRIADPGYRTCATCLDRLREQLREIADRWAALDPSPSAAGDTGRGAPGFGSRPPAQETVICVRDWRSSRESHTWRGADGRLHREHERPPLSVPAELWTLVHHVADARGLTTPTALRVPELVRWLDGHLDWVTRQDGVAAFGQVLRELVAQLRPLTGEPGAKRIGECPNTLDEGDTTRECKRPLYAPLRGDTIHCSCGRTWERPEWEQLGLMLQARVAS